MVETIAPVVYGNRVRYFVAVALHTLGAAVAAAFSGAALGLVGDAFGAPWGHAGAAVVAGAALLYFGREAFRLPVPIFDRKRQVPDWWRTFFAPPVTAFLYGAGLGVGFLTFLGHGTLVVVCVVAVVSGDALAGALLLVPFGLARGLSLLVTVRTTDEEGPALAVARLVDIAAASPRMRWANAAACAALALATLV